MVTSGAAIIAGDALGQAPARGRREPHRALIGRLAAWRATETPEEIGVRTLSALPCSAAAMLIDGPRGPKLRPT
jgi:hypothetical protein